MKIGYACINTSLPCSSSRTFRLASYSEMRLVQTIESNLDCLRQYLAFNAEHNLLFFRISSDLIPFASHPINSYPWQKHFKEEFRRIGQFIKNHHMRISLHPDQFVLINAVNENTFQNSVKELLYHAEVLDLMELDHTAKLQIHVGGVYGNKGESIKRFIGRYKSLPEEIKNRLVIENDDRLFSIKDCFQIYEQTNIPILFDNFHHTLNNNGESVREAGLKAFSTWARNDDIPMVDYSSQDKSEGKRIGKHAESIVLEDFRSFIELMKGEDFDIILEIKDKETSAIKAKKMIEDIRKI